MGLLFPSLLLGGAAWLPSLGGVASGPLSFCMVLPSFSPFLVVLLSLSSSLGWCCLASFVERCCVVPSPFAWCRLPFPPSLGGARFSPLFCWVVLSTFSSFRWGCFPSLFCWLVLPSFPSSFGWGTFCPPLLLGGAALPPPHLGLLFPSLLLGGAAWPPSLGGVASGPLFFCVVLPPFSSFGWGCFPSPLLLGGVAWPPSLGGVALFHLFLRGAASLPHLLWAGLFEKEKSKTEKKTKLKTKNRNKEKQRGKQKEETKKRKN